MAEDAAAKAVELGESGLAYDEHLHVLKNDDLFAVFNAAGDFLGEVHPVGPSTGADGLFQDDTRILSRLTLSLGGRTPQLLAGAVGRDNVLFTAHLTNPSMEDARGHSIASGQIVIHRRRFLWHRKLYEALHVQNHSPTGIDTQLWVDVDADFSDVFEIRGMQRRRRGEKLDLVCDGSGITLSYRGLDGQVRRTSVRFSIPTEIREKRAVVPVRLAREESLRLIMSVSSEGDPAIPQPSHFLHALKRAKRTARRTIGNFLPIDTSNTKFDAWLERAAADLALLVTELDTGPYPYAGIPWFSAPFGRDAILTALQVLWIEPSLARGVLAYLSALQAAEQSEFRDSQPGKIVHELRKGEMAALEEVPFGRYYGGVDTTPLFVVLAGAYLKRTDDVAFARRLWPTVRAALDWIDHFGDLDGDGFIEYRRGAEGGLANQGWKDSSDSVFHADGELARGAIAMVEVQAYVVAAKRAAAAMASVIGEEALSEKLHRNAGELQEKLDRCFWCEEIGTYALALDGLKRPCAVRTSNPGHVLFSGAAAPEKALRVAKGLMARDFFSGWGVRTVAQGESRYNPMSYHNGTVWPHDCSIIAAGLARYGMADFAANIFTGIFDAVCRLPEFRMPELFCGFARRAGEDPVRFPSACTPQAWASGAVFLMLQASLGIEVDAAAKLIAVRRPYLPAWLERVRIRKISIGEASASLDFRRRGADIEVTMRSETGGIHLVTDAASSGTP
jgi:glycogen debranching enzyme